MQKKKGLLHDSFYKEKKQGEYNSVTYADEYFKKHELTSLLRDSLKYLFKDGKPPRNPYASLYRLVCINSVQDSLTSYFNLNSISGISLHSKNKKNFQIQEIRIGTISLFSSHEFASQVDINSIGYIQTIIKNNRFNFNVQSYTAVCGTELLKSKLIKYGTSSQNRLVFKNYLQLASREKGAAEAYSKAVYNAAQDILHAKDLYFKNLTFQTYYGIYQAEEVWTRTDMVLYKTKLFNRLCVFPFEDREVSINYYQKYNGEYILIKQKFYPVVELQGKFYSRQATPFAAVFKGGFLNRDGAQFYINLHQAQTNKGLNEIFIEGNGAWTLWNYYQQNFEDMAWNIYYQIIAVKKDTHGILWDAISSLLCSPIAQLTHFVYQLKTLQDLVQLKIDPKEISNIFGCICTGIRHNFNQGYNAELMLIKDYVIKLCQRLSISKYFQKVKDIKSSEQEVIHILSKIISAIEAAILHYKQILVGFNQSFRKYLYQLYSFKNQLQMKSIQVITFAQFFSIKGKAQVILLNEEIPKVMQQYRVSEAQAKDIITINYFEDTKLKQNVYDFILDICFGAKPHHSLPILIISFIQFVFEYQYKELEINSFELRGKKGEIQLNKIQEAFIDDVKLYSLKDNLKYYSYSFLRIQKYFKFLKIEEKGVITLYSVSQRFLIQDLTLTNVNQNTLRLDIDIVSNNNLEDALQLFYNIIIKKCKQLEKQRNIGVIGFFNKIYILKHFDFKNIPTFQQFKAIIAGCQNIIVKCLISQHRLKMIELVFNLHYITNGWKHLKEIDKFWEYNRVFFQKKHLETWMELYPNTSNLYHQQPDQILDINLSLKKWLIQGVKDKKTKPFILSYCCQRAYQLARESWNHGYLIEYIKMDRTGKFQLSNMKSNIKDHFKSVRKLLKEYTYIYYEGNSITILHYLRLIQDYLQTHMDNNGEENQLIWLQHKFMRVGTLLNCSSQSIILYYRNYLVNKKESSFIY